MDQTIKDTARRIESLRQILEIPQLAMAELTGVSLEEYQVFESGAVDFPFTFLHKCAAAFEVDIVELVSGENPKLDQYSVIKKGKGLKIWRKESLNYFHLNYRMKNRKIDAFKVIAPIAEEEQDLPITLAAHKGHEFNFILKGSLKVQIDDHIEVLNRGDAIYYDSSFKHGMVALGEKDCTFLAIVVGE